MEILSFKEKVLEKLKEVEEKLADPEVTSNLDLLQSLGKEHNRLSTLKELFEKYESVNEDIKALEELKHAEEIDEEEYNSMVEEAEKNLKNYYLEILSLLIPGNEINERNIIMEIRAGTGGEEAALFASDLMRMYLRYAENKGWKHEIMELSDTGIGGTKNAVIKIKGKGVFGRLKYESGVHRVQRVPVTESGGRIHTSTATVAVLPEATDVDVKIEDKDLRIDTYRAGGAGGQHVNKTESAVRIVHLPTGIVVTCQNERSQHQNKEAAMSILRAKLYEEALRKQHEELTSQRRSQIGTGERSEKIRTYNFPQNRVTDHRIGYTSYRLGFILDGDLDEIIDKLMEWDLTEKLENLEI
ncbi:peptide chain release factor 1 [Marinitoga sp. 1135]|uniref:peptide chain release factor 1 n=1 Tax=Marinitoga sp. 1137 TaxID=1545835 RepID=UPI0009504F66|nr:MULTISPECIES: peptide chain release factor 1 [unclassified Marinitoga]APT75376.1 peptide chain release factor 1 [Marinitoga sp. 1137]NUU95109.1 peptide chain release factor 1 [Marinitoga sp. 1135]NUU97041.1 peptide chain release factor 1 [Marinitoga sp. 1138]